MPIPFLEREVQSDDEDGNTNNGHLTVYQRKLDRLRETVSQTRIHWLGSFEQSCELQLSDGSPRNFNWEGFRLSVPRRNSWRAYWYEADLFFDALLDEVDYRWRAVRVEWRSYAAKRTFRDKWLQWQQQEGLPNPLHAIDSYITSWGPEPEHKRDSDSDDDYLWT